MNKSGLSSNKFFKLAYMVIFGAIVGSMFLPYPGGAIIGAIMGAIVGAKIVVDSGIDENKENRSYRSNIVTAATMGGAITGAICFGVIAINNNNNSESFFSNLIFNLMCVGMGAGLGAAIGASEGLKEVNK